MLKGKTKEGTEWRGTRLFAINTRNWQSARWPNLPGRKRRAERVTVRRERLTVAKMTRNRVFIKQPSGRLLYIKETVWLAYGVTINWLTDWLTDWLSVCLNECMNEWMNDSRDWQKSPLKPGGQSMQRPLMWLQCESIHLELQFSTQSLPNEPRGHAANRYRMTPAVLYTVLAKRTPRTCCKQVWPLQYYSCPKIQMLWNMQTRIAAFRPCPSFFFFFFFFFGGVTTSYSQVYCMVAS